MRRILVHDEELAAGGIRVHGPCHGKNAAGVLKIIFYAVLGKLALDRIAGTAHAASLRVAALDHESFNDAVEDQPVIEILISKLLKIINGDRGDIRIKLPLHNTAILHCDRNCIFLIHRILLIYLAFLFRGE